MSGEGAVDLADIRVVQAGPNDGRLEVVVLLWPDTLCGLAAGTWARGGGERVVTSHRGHITNQREASQSSRFLSDLQIGSERDAPEEAGSSVAWRAASLARVLISA